jgi:hypothetical protein
MSFEDVLNSHHDCSVVIIPRYHKNRPRLIDGLYCECHAKLIKWLTTEQTKELTAMGVERLEPIAADKMALARQQVKWQDQVRRTQKEINYD